MSFSFLNPDVDPLSLNERVRKLESRLSPGGSGGGAFVGSIPDFDQYPDNAVKVTNEGVIVKLSFDDLGVNIGPAEAGGIGLKCCGFMPFWGGMLGGFQFVAARIYYKYGLNPLPPLQHKNASKTISFDVGEWLDYFFHPTAGLIHPVYLTFSPGGLGNHPYPRVINLLTLQVYVGLIGTHPATSRNQASVTVNMYATAQKQESIKRNTYAFEAFWMSGSSTMAMGRFSVGVAPGGWELGSNFSVENLQQVPPSAHQTYPASWLVP